MSKSEFDATPKIIYGDVAVAETVSSEALRAPIGALFDVFTERYPDDEPQIAIEFNMRVIITKDKAVK